MEKPGDPRRAQSLDRSHTPRKDSESTGCQCLSLPGTPCRKAPRRAISDGAGCAQSPSPSSGAQGTGAAAAHTLEEMRGFVLSEQRHPPDTKKDKAQRQAQQGWLKTMLNFFLRTGFEEPKDKASRRPKGKEEPPQPPEAAEELVLRKKAQDKKTGHKKCGHRKHGAEEAKGNHHRDAGGHRARLPKMAAASHSEEAEGGPVCRDGQAEECRPDTHTPPPCVPGGLDPSSAGARAGLSNVSPQAQATGPRPEEEPRTPDQEAVIQMTVELLKKVGDQWEDELQAPQPEALLQNPAPACRRKSQEKMPGRVKRAFSLKKCGPEEPRRARAAHVPSPEARPPKRPSFLPLCIRGPWLSTSSSPGSEGPGAHEALSADGDGPRPLELPTCTGCQGPEEGLLLDRASEPNDFMQKILALLQGAEEPEGQQTLVQETEAAGESLALACKKKSQEKKPSSLRRAFSHKRHSSKEPRRAETVGAATPEPRPSKRSSFLPLCVGGPDAEGLELQEHSATEGTTPGFSEAASQARSCTPDGEPQPERAHESKELVICKLVALLQEEDGELGRQIQRHPGLKRCFEEFSDSSLWRLVATLRSRKAGPLDGDGSLLPKRIFPFALGVGSKYAEGHSRTICSLMGSRGHYGQHGGAQCPSKEAQPDLTSPECQSPD